MIQHDRVDASLRTLSEPESAPELRAAVSAAFQDVLGTEGTAGPFGSLISPQDKPFLLVNHVVHQRDSESDQDFAAKITSTKVIEAVVSVLGEALQSTSQITIGNAPLQGCNYDLIREQSGIAAWLDSLPQQDRPTLQDLRGMVTTWTKFGAKLGEERRSLDDAVEVDLGTDSWLDELYENGREPQFRVGDYSGEETSHFHSRGRHVYVINRALLETNLIVSVPTLKTHQKVGITTALKGTVGAIYLKQCLAHHTLGGPDHGGDEFSPDRAWLRMLSRVNEHTAGLGTGLLPNAERVAGKVGGRIARKTSGTYVGGAWYGNNTAWRMTLDIARVLRFARPDGTLAATPQREHVALIDGIVAGEGEGPLRPTARTENLVIAGADPVAADVLAALAMGWEPRVLPLLDRAVADTAYPPSNHKDLQSLKLTADGSPVLVDGPSLTDRPFFPPKGWDPRIIYKKANS